MCRCTVVKNSGTVLALFVLLLFPCRAQAAVEWATWNPPVGNVATGEFSGGQTVILVADFTGITHGTAAGTSYTASPPVVGRPDDTNPPYMGMMTGSTTLNPGDNVALVDLSNLPVGASVIFGIGDQKYSARYQLELRDAAFAIVPLDCVVRTPYNVTYPPLPGDNTPLIADYNSVLIGNVLWVDTTHDAGGFYLHTGLTTLSNLPPETRYILLSFPGPGVQDPEGIQIYVGAELSSTLTVTDAGGNSVHDLAFGNVTIGDQGLQTVTVTNGTASPVAVSFSDVLALPFANPDNCTRTLSPAESCTISVTFTPTDETPRDDSFTFDLGGTPWTVAVSGTGVLPSVSITGSTLFDNTTKVLDFAATVPATSTGSGTVTFTNTSGINLPVHLVEGLGGPFSFLDNAACDRTLGILGADTSCTMTVVFAPDANGVFTDTFKVNAGGVDHTITVRGNPGLANADFGIRQTVSPVVVSPNGTDTTIITLTVRNDGPAAAAAVVTDVLPAGLTVDDAAPATVGGDNRTVTWDVGMLASGSESTLEITARAGTTATGCLSNTAAVTVADSGVAVDSNGANNSATVYIGAPVCADLAISETAATYVEFSLDSNYIHIQHSIRVTNNGPGPATGATLEVTDYAGTGQYNTSRTILTPEPRTISIGNIAVGETVAVLVSDFEVARASGDHTVRIAATVGGSEPDPNSGNNSSSGTYLIDGENPSRDFRILSCDLSSTGRKPDTSLTDILGSCGSLLFVAFGLKAYSVIRYRRRRRNV